MLFLTVMRTRIFNKVAVGSLVNRFFWRKTPSFLVTGELDKSTQAAQCLGSEQPFWFLRLCFGPAPIPTPRDWISGSVKSCKLSLLPKERLPRNWSGWRAGMDQSCFLVYWSVQSWYEEHWEVKVNSAQYCHFSKSPKPPNFSAGEIFLSKSGFMVQGLCKLTLCLDTKGCDNGWIYN